MTFAALSLVACDSIKNGAQDTVKETTENAVPKPPREGSSIDLGYMNNAVRPQDDFFEFANGSWIKNNPVPASESRWGSFNELDQTNKSKLTAILDAAKENQGEKGSMNQLLGAYYSSYTQMEIREKLGVTPIADELEIIRKINSKKDIYMTIAEHHAYGIGSIFGFGVGQDLKDVDNHISYFGQGGIGLPNRDYYFSEDKAEILKEYKRHISIIAGMAEVIEEGTTVDQFAASVINVETQLAESMMRPAELRIPENTYNKMHRNDLTQMMGGFDFEGYLKGIGSMAFDSVIVAQPEFAKKIAKMMNDVSLTDWKNYLKWQVLDHYAGSLSSSFVDQNFEFYGKVLSGKKEMKPINERAIDNITGKSFGELLGKAFVEKHYSAQAQQRVNEMVDNLLAVFQERIDALDWMSGETKTEASVKLNSIGRKLGFPTKWEDFSSLDFSNERYVQNLKNVALYDHRKNMKELNKPVDKDAWGMPAHMVNAYYHPLLNEIAFPAGIMQAPFFSDSYEDAVNYGRIGMVIGHEFTHGFDDMGSKFAADGSFRNWWTESDRKLFEERTGKLGMTFAGFCPIDGHCVNPDLTMGENIADLGGLTMAYYAYARTGEFQKGEKKMGYTPAQRFFIAYAQLWKINYTEEELKNRIANDPHSPGMYRVNGPLMNCPEFFEAFDVKESDPMRNSEEEISKIW